MEKNLQTVLIEAKKDHFAVPAFNIVDYTSAAAVISAGEDEKTPIIMQTSTGTVKWYGAKHLAGMVAELKSSAKVPVFLHLDHCTEMDLAKECVDSGWDSIMFDGSKFPYDENVAKTREIAEYAHKKGLTVEGELGTIVGVEEEIQVDKAKLPSIEECLSFVEAAGIDIFAPAIGTAHGLYSGEPKIDFDLVKKVSENIKQPFVVHGGTGLDERTFKELVQLGAAKINISTALKYAYYEGLKNYATENGDKIAPVDTEKAKYKAIKKMAVYHIKTFRV